MSKTRVCVELLNSVTQYFTKFHLALEAAYCAAENNVFTITTKGRSILANKMHHNVQYVTSALSGGRQKLQNRGIG